MTRFKIKISAPTQNPLTVAHARLILAREEVKSRFRCKNRRPQGYAGSSPDLPRYSQQLAADQSHTYRLFPTLARLEFSTGKQGAS